MNDNSLTGTVKTPERTIVGKLFNTQVLSGQVSQDGKIVGNIATAITTTIGADPYTGSYEITPTVEGLKLDTKQKYMSKDVTVHAIPFFKVGNTSGGNTVYIAGEIEME